jgi:hypothetical protein
MLLPLLAPALPTAALANTSRISFDTGTFVSTGASQLEFGHPFEIFVQGTKNTITLFTPDLLEGLGFRTGTVTVENLAGVTVFENSVSDGFLTPTEEGIIGGATLVPNATVISDRINFHIEAASVFATTIPEPDTLGRWSLGCLELAWSVCWDDETQAQARDVHPDLVTVGRHPMNEYLQEA